MTVASLPDQGQFVKVFCLLYSENLGFLLGLCTWLVKVDSHTKLGPCECIPCHYFIGMKEYVNLTNLLSRTSDAVAMDLNQRRIDRPNRPPMTSLSDDLRCDFGSLVTHLTACGEHPPRGCCASSSLRFRLYRFCNGSSRWWTTMRTSTYYPVSQKP